ncbi:MAG TPA: hypothetical protein DCZ91_23130 [Lachnospiraceae bacterium]|nr:hypothetical protein [Lachnospiraceae bacterium]
MLTDVLSSIFSKRNLKPFYIFIVLLYDGQRNYGMQTEKCVIRGKKGGWYSGAGQQRNIKKT